MHTCKPRGMHSTPVRIDIVAHAHRPCLLCDRPVPGLVSIFQLAPDLIAPDACMRCCVPLTVQRGADRAARFAGVLAPGVRRAGRHHHLLHAHHGRAHGWPPLPSAWSPPTTVYRLHHSPGAPISCCCCCRAGWITHLAYVERGRLCKGASSASPACRAVTSADSPGGLPGLAYGLNFAVNVHFRSRLLR